jgi:hypothetical protein
VITVTLITDDAAPRPTKADSATHGVSVAATARTQDATAPMP